jgi:hypothetical protein
MKAGTLDGISYLHSSQRSIGLLSQVLGHAGPKHGGEDEYDDCRDEVEYGPNELHGLPFKSNDPPACHDTRGYVSAEGSSFDCLMVMAIKEYTGYDGSQ